MTGLWPVAGLFLASAAVYARQPCGDLLTENAWVREAPPVASVLAGYVRLSNKSSAPLKLDHFRSDDFGAIELHRTVMANGEMRMLRDTAIELAPGESAILEPGGRHLMLFRPQRALKAGDEVQLSLDCNGSALRLVMPVRKED